MESMIDGSNQSGKLYLSCSRAATLPLDSVMVFYLLISKISGPDSATVDGGLLIFFEKKNHASVPAEMRVPHAERVAHYLN